MTSEFDYSAIPPGYYDDILNGPPSVRRFWHEQKFETVRRILGPHESASILDIGCFAGSFLAGLDRNEWSKQVGIDILENQVAWAQNKYGTDFRKFVYRNCISDFQDIQEVFDAVTLIEVIEHLDRAEISKLLHQIARLLKPGGELVITTPNYFSHWPLLEFLVNRFSDVKYSDQHITHFHWFNCPDLLFDISTEFKGQFQLEAKTTSHFIAPCIAGISYHLAQRISKAIRYSNWSFPLGPILILKFRKSQALGTARRTE